MSKDYPALVVAREPVPGATRQANTLQSMQVLILGGLSALGPLSTDMYLPALPALSADLGATMSQTQLTLSAGILGLALGQVVAGPSSDALGRRRPLLIGLAAFVVISLLCTVAPSVTALVVLRFLQGVAGAAGIAIALAIVSDLYTGDVQARFYSALAQITGIAPIVAPVIGSQVLAFASWRWVFVILALIGTILLLAAGFWLRETLPASRRQSGGLTTSLRTFRRLLSDRRFIGYTLTSGLAVASGIVYISVSPFILESLYGITPQHLGWVFGVNALGLVLMAQIGGRLIGRVSPRTLLTWGIGMMVVGSASLLVVVLSGVGIVGVLASLFVIVSSLGFIMPNSTALALADTEAAGSASALLGVLQLTIGAFAAPLVGLAGTTTAIPMAALIATFSLATLATYAILCRPSQATTQTT